MGEWSYPSTDTAPTGGDLKVPIKIPNGPSGEKSLHHQQNTIDEEGCCHSINHIFKDVNPEEAKQE